MPVKPSAPPAEADTAEPLFQKPDIKVLNRRLENPFGRPSPKIDLKQPGWVLRMIDRQLRTNRFWEIQESGWRPVHWQELADPTQADGCGRSPEGYVVRGERQNEVLMKIPAEWWAQIQHRKEAMNRRAIQDPLLQKRELLNAAATTLGPDTADFMENRIVGEVVERKERIERLLADE